MQVKHKSYCWKCNKNVSITTVHIPILKNIDNKVCVDFIEKMYCLKCGKEIK